MSALTIERETQKMSGDAINVAKYTLKVKGSTKIFAGSLVCIDSGYAKPCTAAAGLIAAGKAMLTADNTTGADGAISVYVEPGTFKWDPKSGDAPVQANVGALCYMTDDHTVQMTATTNSAAGHVIQVDADGGVWVQTGIGI